jgi:hypothetical protein
MPIHGGAVRRLMALLMAVTLVGSACGNPQPSPSRQPFPVPSAQPTDPQASGAVAPSAGPTEPGPQPSGPAPSGGGLPTDPDAPVIPIPADIAADVAALDAATDREAAMAAARTLLEKSGVVITDDPDAAEPTPAAIYVTTPMLALIADEALSGTRLERATLSDFATTFGGIAGISGDEGYQDLLDEIEFDSDGPAPNPSADPLPPIVDVPFDGVQERVTGMVSTWVGEALAVHAPAEADLTELTSPALYLQAFAAQQDPVLDLREPFLASDLAMDTLELTILMAGMRSMFSWAQDPDILSASGPAESDDDVMGGPATMPAAVPAAASSVGDARTAGAALPVDCDGLKHMIDSFAPLSGFVAARSKESVKFLVKAAIDRLFGAGTWAARNVGNGLKVMSVFFKVLAVTMLYEHAVAKLEINPGFLHKPIGQPRDITAHVVTGIPDAEWNEAKAQRENDPWTFALKRCASFLGLPVTSDLVDVGEGVKSWVVRWEVTSGLGHVLIPASQLVGPGITTQRLERPLKKKDDHSGEDTLTIAVQPEREADHPGREVREPVRICAKVVPREPAGGFKTLISAGFAGVSMAGGTSIQSALVTTIASLLAAWYREVAEIEACEVVNVLFHRPDPGVWRGRIRVEMEKRVDFSSVVREGYDPTTGGPRMVTTEYDQQQVDVTDTFYVSGGEPLPGETSTDLEIHQVTHGIARYRSGQEREGWLHQPCRISEVRENDHYGTWHLTADVRGSLQVGSGGVTINWNASQGDLREAPMDGETAHVLAILQGDCIGEVDETTSNQMFAFPLIASGEVSSVQGQIDPQKPDRVVGSQTFTNFDGTITTKVTWDLRHNGPIR